MWADLKVRPECINLVSPYAHSHQIVKKLQVIHIQLIGRVTIITGQLSDDIGVALLGAVVTAKRSALGGSAQRT